MKKSSDTFATMLTARLGTKRVQTLAALPEDQLQRLCNLLDRLGEGNKP